MKRCLKCGADLEDHVKYCQYCGEKFEEKKNVEGDSTLEENQDLKNTMNTKDKSNNPRMENNIEVIKTKGINFWNKLNIFQKIASVVLIAFILMCLYAFIIGKIIAGIISASQIILVIIALLMNKNIIKTSKKWNYILVFIIAIALTIPYIPFVNNSEGNYEKYNWEDVVLLNEIPKPESKYGVIHANSNENLMMDVYKTSDDDFNDYVIDCKSKGFTTDVDHLDTSFTAFNKKGYKVSLLYFENKDEMQISLDAPIKLGKLNWPDNDMAKLLPKPKSSVGRIEKDDKSRFMVYVGETTQEEFQYYISLCSEKGFNVDMDKSNKQFSAKNSESYKLSVDYQGNDIMLIILDEPEFNIDIEIDCRENWMFSKYDVDVYIDDDFKGCINHGGEKKINEGLLKEFIQ